MPAASAPQLATWRTAPYAVYTDVYVHAPEVIFAARVNMATVSYPLTQLTYDTVTTGAYTDLLPEMMLLLGTSAGADDLGRVRVHAIDIAGTTVATSTLIYIGRCSQGTRDGELNVADNMYISVINLRAIWATPPRIDVSNPDSPVTYKDGVIAFSAGDEFKPVPIMGGDRLKFTTSIAGTASFDFTAASSYKTDPAAGSTLTYLWGVGDGTITSGSTTTAAITVSFPVGARYLRLKVTDDQGNIEESWRLVVVTYSGDPNLVSKATIRRSQRADGQQLTVQLDSDLPYSTYPDGTEVLVYAHEFYGGVEGSIVGEGLIFAGWIQEEPGTRGIMQRTGFRRWTQLTLADVAGKLKTLPGFPLVVNRKASPTTWEDMRSAQPDLYGYHLIKWHSNVLRRCDYLWSGVGSNYPFTTLGSDGKSLWEQIAFPAIAMAQMLTCDQTDRIHIVGDPNILPTATQASAYGSLPVTRTTTQTVAIGEGDWKDYELTYTRPPRTHWNWGSAIVSSTTEPSDTIEIGTVFCVAPGVAPGQGLNEQTSGQQLVFQTSPQNELNIREGNRYAARLNARYGNVSFNVRAGDIGIDPALGEWCGLTVSTTTAAQRGRTLSGHWLPLEITYDYDGRHGICKKRISFEQEVVGTPAQLDPSRQNIPVTQYPDFPPTPPITLPSTGGSSGLPPNTPVLYAFDSTHNLVWRYLRETGAWEQWIDLTALGLGGSLVAAEWRVGGNVARLCTNSECRVLNNYSSGTPALGTAHSFPESASLRQMRTIGGIPDWVIISTYIPGTGTRVDWSTDNLATVTRVNVSSNYDTNGANLWHTGIYLSEHVPGKAYICAHIATGANAAGDGWMTTNYGASWAQITNPNIDPGFGLAQAIASPVADPTASTVYFGHYTIGEDRTLYRVVGGGATVDISPVYGGITYGAVGDARSISVADDDPNSLFVATQRLGFSDFGVFYTRSASAIVTGSAGWTPIVAPSVSSPWLGMYAVNRNGVYLYGSSGAVGYWDGNVLNDLTIPGAGLIVALMGN